MKHRLFYTGFWKVDKAEQLIENFRTFKNLTGLFCFSFDTPLCSKLYISGYSFSTEIQGSGCADYAFIDKEGDVIRQPMLSLWVGPWATSDDQILILLTPENTKEEEILRGSTPCLKSYNNHHKLLLIPEEYFAGPEYYSEWSKEDIANVVKLPENN